MPAHNYIDMGLGRIIARQAELNPNARALTFESKTLTYRELSDRIDRLAEGLRAGGIERGDRVGFLGVNHPAFVETMFAAGRLGAIYVPLNYRLTAAELAFIINDAGIRAIIVDDDHKPLIDEVRAELVTERYIGSESGGPGWESLEDLIGSHEPLTDPVAAQPDDVALIMYTSGTTGRPKGAMLSHGNIFYNNVNLMSMGVLGEKIITLAVAPLFHVGGLNVNVIVTWQMGGEVVVQRTFDPASALRAIQEHRITHMFGVPAMYLFMSQQPEFATTDMSSVSSLCVGGAPVPERLLRTYLAKGLNFNHGYGLTETAPFSTFLKLEYSVTKLGSAGLPPPYTDVAILDPEGHEVAPGERGEVCTRGPNVMLGYWNRPDATAAAIDEAGWFHSGDVGYKDADGFVYICDRLKDMVISGGENVYPAEVESVIYDHPKVREVAVIGLADERWGEAVVAVCACSEGEILTLEELRDFAGRSLARYKLPSRLHIVPALPRNPAGKVLKFELRKMFENVPAAP
jgi:fatty-acyl-CoA synthase